MIISDTHRFAFMHIPKCAGTTVRQALAPYDEHASEFYDKAVFEHPAFGPLDHHHIPLQVMRDHFPEAFAKLRRYQSFALIRDPFSRFPSSLHERFVQRDRRPLNERSALEMSREVETVISALAKHPRDVPITDPGLIHFSRQSDYVFHNGEQIVKSLKVVAEIDGLFEDLSGLIGRQLRPEERKNRQMNYSVRALARLQFAVTRPIEKLLPRWVWKPVYKPIKQVFFAAGLLRKDYNPLLELPNADDIKGFISEFYADDVRLFNSLESARVARAEHAEVG